MLSDPDLEQIVLDLIGRGSEGVYWDFKLKHHRNAGDLLHDVLCLANTEHDGPRFLVFGVENGGVSVQTIQDDDRRRSQADIAGLFRDNAGKFFQSRFPTFHLRTIEIASKQVDVLIIEDEPKKPYYLVEKIKNVRAHHIYTRVCDTNTPVDRVAHPHEIERMWRQRFGLDASALERAKRCLAEPAAWTLREEDGFVCCHHDIFPEFTLNAASADEDHMDSSQEWTRGEIRIDDAMVQIHALAMLDPSLPTDLLRAHHAEGLCLPLGPVVSGHQGPSTTISFRESGQDWPGPPGQGLFGNHQFMVVKISRHPTN
ncbi:MAG: ATP-binding protein [Bryobacterales bacterium]|nr:ATP-binding protein [Bryobacterales bacterium]MDE0432799.1 ATP-binding protein [Bryobacterales bacterium]